MADTTERKEYLIDVKTNYQKYIDELNAARKALEEQQVAQLRLTEEQKKDADFMAKFTAETRNLQTAVRNGTKIVDQATLANKAQEGSYEQLYRTWQVAQTRLKLLGGAYETNADGVKVLSQKYVQYKADVENAKRGLDSFGKGIADNRLNVGNYSEAIQGALGGLQQIPGVAGQAAGGLSRLTTVFKALIANPIVLAITATIAAIKGLIEVFKSTDKGGTELAARMEQLRAIVDVLRQRVVTLIEAFGHLFKGEFREAGEAFKATVTGIGDALGDATKAAYDYAYAMDAVKDAESNYISQSADIQNQIAKLEFTAQDRTKSLGERKKALQQALDLGLQEVQKTQEFAKARLDAELEYLAGKSGVRAEDILGFVKMTDAEQANAAESLKTVRNNNEAKFDEIENLYAKWIQADTKFFEENKRNISKLSGFEEKERADAERAVADARKAKEQAEKDMLDAKTKLTKELDDYKKFIAEQQAIDAKALEDKKQMQLDHDEWERNRVAENEENLLQIRELNNEYAFSIQRARLEQQKAAEIQAAEDTGADLNTIQLKYAAAQRTIDETEAAAKLGLYADFAGNIAQIFGENTAIGKAAAVAQTTIATYQAAVESYKSLAGIPVVGVGLGIAAAAAAVAAGLANVKKILAVKSGLPGDTGGGGSAPTSITSSVPAQRTFATAVGSSFVTQPQLTQQQVNALPAQPALTADDIAAAVAKLPAPIVSVEDINARSAEVQKVEVRGIV